MRSTCGHLRPLTPLNRVEQWTIDPSGRVFEPHPPKGPLPRRRWHGVPRWARSHRRADRRGRRDPADI